MSVTRAVRSSLAALVLACIPQVVAAQIFTPTFMSPRAGGSLGAYVSDLGDFAAEGILRGNFGGYDLGIRGGVVDFGGTDFTIGGEFRNPLAFGSAPLDVALTAGAQALFGDADVWGAQVGLSLGATVVPGAFTLTPYIHPRVAFVDSGRETEADAELVAEVGADFGFSGGLALRFAAALDNVGADWGVGLSWAR